MGSLLDKLKEGIGALNPLGSKVDKPKPVKPPVAPGSGYLKDSATKATKRIKETQDIADQV